MSSTPAPATTAAVTNGDAAPNPHRSPYTQIDPDAAASAVASTRHFAQTYMDLIGDPSHDWAHVQRVLGLALGIADTEVKRNHADGPQVGPIDRTIVTLAALLHDVGDRKYIQHLRSSFNTSRTAIREGWTLDFGGHPAGASGLVYQWLRGYTPLTEDTAVAVQAIVSHTSYSGEMGMYRGEMSQVLGVYPEFGVVQDADRLDALGVVGLGRCFSYNAAEGVRRKEEGFEAREQGGGAGPEGQPSLLGGLKPAVEHIDDKLLRLEGMMKTQTGRQWARERSRRLVVMREWLWDEVCMRNL